MTTDIEAYKHSSFYRNFMERAFKTGDRSKPMMQSSVIHNLYRSENGNDSMKRFIGSYEKQLETAKKYMHKAMVKFLSIKKLSPEILSSLDYLDLKIDSAESPDDLMEIVYKTLELTHSAK